MDVERAAKLRHRVSGMYGVNITRQGALFVQPEISGERVSIVGDFNDWSADATPLRLSQRLGVWQGCLDLPPGRYSYCLSVDDQTVADPHNDRAEVDAKGRMTSIFEVSA